MYRFGTAERGLTAESLHDVRENLHLKVQLVGDASTQDVRDLGIEV
jgi:hypothetical protein